MNPIRESPRAAQVRGMFARIARRYDRLNRLMTFGRDAAWRREAVDRLVLSGGNRALDVGAGTGDLARECLRRAPDLHIVACDFTPEMIAAGRRRAGRIDWVIADAHHLPFQPNSFEAVISGFLLRNVEDPARALAEQVRVLRPGGRLSCLDTTPPSDGRVAALVRFHLRRVIPALGRIFAGDEAAYRYLPTSTEAFLTAEDLAARLPAAGLGRVRFTRRMLGTIAIHSAVKHTRA